MRYLKEIYTVLLGAYILASLLVPLAGYNKLIFIALLLIYGGYIFFYKKENRFEFLKTTIAPIVIILIFLYGFVRGYRNGADMVLAKQFFLATSTFVLIYPIDEFRIDFNKLMTIIAKLYILFFLIYAIYAINMLDYQLPMFIKTMAHMLDNSIIRAVGKTLEAYGGGWISYRSFFGGIGMMIYLGSVPFLLILTDVLVIEFLNSKKITNLFWIALGVMLSFTAGLRTLMLLVPASVCLLVWLSLDRKKKISSFVILFLMGIGIFIFLLNRSTFFSLSDSSNSAKIGHFVSYFKQLSLGKALFGDGLASYYFSSGTGYEVAHTEITFIDHCRYFGIPLGVTVWGLLVCPKPGRYLKDWKNWRVWEMQKETAVFILYLVFAQTNPVLFNSFGLVAVLWYWNEYLCRCRN